MKLKFSIRLRRLVARALRRAAQTVSPEFAVDGGFASLQPYATEGWDHIPQGQYDYVPKGTYVFGPADRFLLVPKNRYRAVLLPNQSRRSDLGIGWLTEDNTAEGYDLLWGDEARLDQFRAEGNHAREKLKAEIIDHIDAFIPPNANVTDIGCGIGDLLTEVRTRKLGVKVSGLDFSAKAVEGARASLPDGEFIQFVIDRTLPYEDNAFDVVLCTDVMEHLEHPKAVASELVRICRSGGIVAIVVPDGDVDQFMGHNWFWNQQSLTALLADWDAEVSRLPITREFIACIFPKNVKREI
ncbi:methyltransferase domain-containing protein [Rhizobium leguminosarum bv. viciae]|uniref:Methyltransferase domain-containing protein n=1 Tax=Rhizobium leguminosarum bv. viciae TaxID=387 RepID=A0A8I2KKI7_RHILV|nr:MULTISPECIES: class I SAM-dependent methyltransferase [Rhizobium]NKM50174.1 methyltransferase domain-containing protein [Rhizobium leguminosarum bv. viciae]TBX75223.1 class I SAM-dependent methyltransferase [Rhizobium laguerreae]TBY08421.1 class I SAM-dependent methyltransferase [Rhizobium laguerreae]